MEQKEIDRLLKKLEMTGSGKISAFKTASILLGEIKSLTLQQMINEVRIQEIVSRACAKGGSVGHI